MNGKAGGAACVVAGLGLAAAGWRLIKSQEHPESTTGFEGPGLNRRGALMLLGNVLLGLGLVIAVIISSFFFIGG
ncbi:MAG TPA: hypothetical protein VH309_05905 [Elusimicrobiota bacterium]|jgi:hypothetical protein|nr:hypothetical protein [Elusimicrobiota bacterium]